jgi:sugar phosphate isomerase/epimerase
VETAARAIGELAEAAKEIGSSVGLYNHGGWFGDPRNQIAIIKALNMPNIGIVYNFHHGHEYIDQFPSLFSEMQPYLLTVNLNGMKVGGPQILVLGAGDRELEMLQVIFESGYPGPVGILDHQSERDSREVLEENLEGLRSLMQRLKD